MSKTVRIESDDIFAAPGACRVIDIETGREIPGVTRVEIDMEVGELIKSKITLLSAVNVVSEGDFYAISPKDGEAKRVKSIEFEDGEKLEF